MDQTTQDALSPTAQETDNPSRGDSPQTRTLARWLDRGRVPSLDGLRCISILFVLLAHMGTCGFYRLPVGEKFYTTLGATGVDIFFVISGFIITLLLLREKSRSGTVSLKAFYSRRALRIFPAYIAFLLAVVALSHYGLASVSRRSLLAACIYMSDFNTKYNGTTLGHLWSLSVEEHFYFIWPFLLLSLGALRARGALIVCLLIEPVLRMVGYVWFRNWIDIDFCTFTRLDTIGVGCLLALFATDAQSGSQFYDTIARQRHLGLTALFLLIGSIALGSVWGKYAIMAEKTVNAIAIAGFLWYAATNVQSLTGRVLNSKPFVAIGVLSYSIYIWQELFLTYWRGENLVLRSIFYVIAVATVSIGSYRLIELPFLNMKERLSNKRADPSGPVLHFQEPVATEQP